MLQLDKARQLLLSVEVHPLPPGLLLQCLDMEPLSFAANGVELLLVDQHLALLGVLPVPVSDGATPAALPILYGLSDGASLAHLRSVCSCSSWSRRASSIPVGTTATASGTAVSLRPAPGYECARRSCCVTRYHDQLRQQGAVSVRAPDNLRHHHLCALLQLSCLHSHLVALPQGLLCALRHGRSFAVWYVQALMRIS